MKPILMMGSAAYSPFRLDALRAALAAADKALANVSIDARWVYAIDPEGEGPDAETLERAALLLNAENGEWGTGNGERGAFYVTPRKGTISPWSSKATDIFRNCGLKGIARVERGIRYCITSDGSGKSAASPNQQPLGEAALSPLREAEEITKRMPRSTRAMPFRPQLRKMSVAFDDHGEIVPFRGVTKNAPSLSSSAPTALRSRAARCSVSSSGPSPSGWMA